MIKRRSGLKKWFLEQGIWLLSITGGLSVLAGYCWLLLGDGVQPIAGPVVLGAAGFSLTVAALILWCIVPRDNASTRGSVDG